MDEIKECNYNLDIKNPYQDEDDLGDPLHLLNHYQERLRHYHRLLRQDDDTSAGKVPTWLVRLRK